MINHILLICSSVIIYEFLIYIKFRDIIKYNLKVYKKILKLFKYKKVSDFRKEKLLFNYSKKLLLVSIKTIFILISIFIFKIALNSLSNSYLNLVISAFGIVELSVIFIIYHLIRKKLYSKLY